MSKCVFTHCVELVGEAPKHYIGEKLYVSTGAVDCNVIDQTQIERVTFENKPSRANLIVEDGDVLFAKMQNTHKVVLVNNYTKEYVYSTGFCAVRAKKQFLTRECLFYLLNSPQFCNQKDNLCSGATQKAITNEALSKLTINIPEIAEQGHVVKILDKISVLIEKRKQQLEKLDLLVKSKFIEMFGHIQEKVTVSQLAKVMGGFSFQSQDITNNGVRLLQISNVTLNDIIWDVCNYLPKSYFERYSAFSLQKNDIIMALTRPIIQSLGNVKTSIVKDSDIPSLLNQRVARIKALECNYVFLFYCFMTNDFTQYVIENCSGSSQPNMSTKAIEKYLIPKVDITIQDEFATFVEQVDKLKSTVKQSLEKLETLKKSLMQKYFG